MDVFIIQIAVIFIPGIIWERIETLCALKRRPDQFDVVRRTFIYGLISYFLTYGLYVFMKWQFNFLQIEKDKTFFNENLFNEILIASGISFVCSVFYLYFLKYKLLLRAFRKIGATSKYGDEDVWDYTLSTRSLEFTYIHLRDFEKKITYAGYVKVLSESEKIRELVLTDVIVYNFEGNVLFESPRIYLARAMDNIDIEFPYRGN